MQDIVKDENYYMSLDKRSKEYKDWKARKEQTISAAVNVESENNNEEIVKDKQEDNRLIKVKSDGTVEKDLKSNFNVTFHRYKMNDPVYAVVFGLVRESHGYEQIRNNARFYVRQGEIEKVIFTDKVQYKLKNVAGSLLDEDMVYFDKCSAEERAAIENGGLHARGKGR